MQLIDLLQSDQTALQRNNQLRDEEWIADSIYIFYNGVYNMRAYSDGVQ